MHTFPGAGPCDHFRGVEHEHLYDLGEILSFSELLRVEKFEQEETSPWGTDRRTDGPTARPTDRPSINRLQAYSV